MDVDEKRNNVEKDLKRRGKFLRGHFLSMMEELGESMDRLEASCLTGGDDSHHDGIPRFHNKS